MAISILNNIASLTAQNQLSVTQANLNNALNQFSTGSRINSGADDAAGMVPSGGTTVPGGANAATGSRPV